MEHLIPGVITWILQSTGKRLCIVVPVIRIIPRPLGPLYGGYITERLSSPSTSRSPQSQMFVTLQLLIGNPFLLSESCAML